MNKAQIAAQTQDVICAKYEDFKANKLGFSEWSWYLCDLLTNYINRRIAHKNILKNGANSEMYEDCHQSALLAIIENCKKYDPYQAMPSSYFTDFIDEAIRKSAVPTKLTSDYYNATSIKLNKEARKMGYSGLLDLNLDITDLSTKTGISVTTIKEAIQLEKTSFCSLDDPDMEQVASMSDFVPEKFILKQEENDFLIGQYEKLTPFEAFILSELRIKDDATTIRKLVGKLNRELKDEFLDERPKVVNQIFIECAEMRALRKIQYSPKLKEYISPYKGDKNIDIIKTTEEDEINDIENAILDNLMELDTGDDEIGNNITDIL